MQGNRLITFIIALALGAGAGYFLTNRYSCLPKPTGKGAYNLELALNKLWSDHVLWTRQYIVSAIADLPDAPAALDRLMHNQDQLGAAIVPYYGKEAGNKLAELLRAHIAIAGDVVKAAKTNDAAGLKESDQKWHDNAADIAKFLHSANPHNWSEEDLKNMLFKHLAITTNEATLRLSKDWKADVTNFDAIFDQALMMAKTLADGIVKQFPDKF